MKSQTSGCNKGRIVITWTDGGESVPKISRNTLGGASGEPADVPPEEFRAPFLCGELLECRTLTLLTCSLNPSRSTRRTARGSPSTILGGSHNGSMFLGPSAGRSRVDSCVNERDDPIRALPPHHREFRRPRLQPLWFRCFESAKMFRMIDRVEGINIAAAIPSSTRAAIKSSALGAKAANVDAPAKPMLPQPMVDAEVRSPVRTEETTVRGISFTPSRNKLHRFLAAIDDDEDRTLLHNYTTLRLTDRSTAQRSSSTARFTSLVPT